MPSGYMVELWDHTAAACFAKTALSPDQFMQMMRGDTMPCVIDVFALDRLGYTPIPEPIPDDAYQVTADLLEHVRSELSKAVDAWGVRKEEVRVDAKNNRKIDTMMEIIGCIEGMKRAERFVAHQISNLKDAGREPGPCRESVIDELIEHLSGKADFHRFLAQKDEDIRYNEGKVEAYMELCDFLRRAAKASVVSHTAPWGHYLGITRELNIDAWKELK